MSHPPLPPIDTDQELIDEAAYADMSGGFGESRTPMQRTTEHIGKTLQDMADGTSSHGYPALDNLMRNPAMQRRPRAPGHGPAYNDTICVPSTCDDPLHWGTFDSHKPAVPEPLQPATPHVQAPLIQDVYPSLPQQVGRLEGQVDGLHQAMADVQGRLANAATREEVRATNQRITGFYKHINEDLREPMNTAIKRLEQNIGLLSTKRLWKDRLYVVWILLAICGLMYALAPPVYDFVTNVIM